MGIVVGAVVVVVSILAAAFFIRKRRIRIPGFSYDELDDDVPTGIANPMYDVGEYGTSNIPVNFMSETDQY